MISIKELDKDSRPRERLIKYGVEALSDIELIAIILRSGSREYNAKELANKILLSVGGINNLYRTTYNELINIKGIKDAKAISLLASIELGKRVLKKNIKDIKINTSEKVYNLLKYDLINCYQEKFIALFLDTKKNLITSKVIFVGTLSISTIHPREIFKEAIINSASSIIVVHNHPSGDSTPSEQDALLTSSLFEIGKLIKIPVIDHIIIGYNNYYSFYEKERIDIND